MRIYPVFSPDEKNTWGNLAVIAHNGPPLPFNASTVRNFPVHRFAERSVREIMGRTFSFPSNTRAIVLTDNYNPVDFYDTWLKEELRRNILKSQDADILG